MVLQLPDIFRETAHLREKNDSFHILLSKRISEFKKKSELSELRLLIELNNTKLGFFMLEKNEFNIEENLIQRKFYNHN